MAKLTATLVSAVLGLSACQMEGVPESDTASTSRNVITTNVITTNVITTNVITTNVITTNALTSNVLESNALMETDEGRQLLAYLIRCSLEDDQTLSVDHDGQTYDFHGLLGLAPAWTQRALDDTEKSWLSSCLIGHVNATGIHVTISMRAIGHLTASTQEMSDYAVYEGTFFGNTFGDDLEFFACTGDEYDVAMANSPARALRVCTDPDDVCEVQSLGRCRDVCDTRVADHGWTDCHANGQVYSETVSVYLGSPDDDGNNKTCGAGQDCNFKINHAEDGILDCSDADECDSTCKNGSICAMDGTSASEFQAVVKNDAIADVNCHEADECQVRVRDQSSVEIDCKDAGDCDKIRCEDGSDCLLDCTGADDCGFQVCEGQLTSCGGDVYACNRGCP